MTEPHFTPEEHEEMIQADRDYLESLKSYKPRIWESLKLISSFTSIVMFAISMYMSSLPSDNVAYDPNMELKVGLWVLTAILVTQSYVLWDFEKEQEK